MATLTPNEISRETTRSTRIDSVSRPRPSMSLSAARDAVIVSGRRNAVLVGVPGAKYAPAAPCGPSNGRSQQAFDLAAAINQSKSIKSTTDEGRTGVDHDGMGAFITSLGSRPPSPPV